MFCSKSIAKQTIAPVSASNAANAHTKQATNERRNKSNRLLLPVQIQPRQQPPMNVRKTTVEPTYNEQSASTNKKNKKCIFCLLFYLNLRIFCQNFVELIHCTSHEKGRWISKWVIRTWKLCWTSSQAQTIRNQPLNSSTSASTTLITYTI